MTNAKWSWWRGWRWVDIHRHDTVMMSRWRRMMWRRNGWWLWWWIRLGVGDAEQMNVVHYSRQIATLSQVIRRLSLQPFVDPVMTMLHHVAALHLRHLSKLLLCLWSCLSHTSSRCCSMCDCSLHLPPQQFDRLDEWTIRRSVDDAMTSIVH